MLTKNEKRILENRISLIEQDIIPITDEEINEICRMGSEVIEE